MFGSFYGIFLKGSVSVFEGSISLKTTNSLAITSGDRPVPFLLVLSANHRNSLGKKMFSVSHHSLKSQDKLITAVLTLPGRPGTQQPTVTIGLIDENQIRSCSVEAG